MITLNIIMKINNLNVELMEEVNIYERRILVEINYSKK